MLYPNDRCESSCEHLCTPTADSKNLFTFHEMFYSRSYGASNEIALIKCSTCNSQDRAFEVKNTEMTF